MVQIVAKRENGNAEDRPQYLGAAMRQSQRTTHHADAKRTDGGWHDKAVIPKTFTKSQCSKDYGEEKPDFVEDRIKQ